VNLVITDRQGVEIDYCPQCRGVWLDRGELDKIIERSERWMNASTAAPTGKRGLPLPADGELDDRWYEDEPDGRRYDDRRSRESSRDRSYEDDRSKRSRKKRRKRESFLSELFDFDLDLFD
jgi:Zn-finger nucleic acid-binding protein